MSLSQLSQYKGIVLLHFLCIIFCAYVCLEFNNNNKNKKKKKKMYYYYYYYSGLNSFILNVHIAEAALFSQSVKQYF